MGGAALPLVLAVPILCAAAWTDLRLLRIPDLLSLLILVVGAAAFLVAPPPDVAVRLTAALAFLALGFVAFGLGMIGGGDVKFLSAFLLLIPAGGYFAFAFLMSVGILVSVLVLAVLRRVPGEWKSRWKSLSGPPRLPVGVAIAFAGITQAAAAASF